LTRSDLIVFMITRRGVEPSRRAMVKGGATPRGRPRLAPFYSFFVFLLFRLPSGLFGRKGRVVSFVFFSSLVRKVYWVVSLPAFLLTLLTLFNIQNLILF
jgi:hypothetical protein